MASITKTKAGRYRVQLSIGNKRRSRNFDTESQAKQWAYQEEHFALENKARLVVDEANNITAHYLFERFKTEVCPRRNRGGKWENYKINYWLTLPDFGELVSTDPEKYKKIIRAYAEQRIKDGKTGNTVCRELTLMSTIFSYAQKYWDIGIKDNPVRLVPRPEADNKPRKERWSDHQVQQIYAAANFKYGSTPELLTEKMCYALSVAVETAMRLGEIWALKKKDYGFEETEKGKQYYVYLATTKNGEERYVPLSSKAKEIVDILVCNLEPDDFLMGGSSADTASTIFRKLKRKAGLTHKHFHDARHEAITRLAKRIPNVMVLSAISGHKELRNLKRYYNPTVSESGSYLS